MQDTIEKLVLLDKKAKQEILQIRENSSRQKESILQNKETVYQQYLLKAKQRIDKIRLSAQQEEEKQEAIEQEKFQQASQTMDAYYAAHQGEWVSEIVRRVLD